MVLGVGVNLNYIFENTNMVSILYFGKGFFLERKMLTSRRIRYILIFLHFSRSFQFAGGNAISTLTFGKENLNEVCRENEDCSAI